MAGIPATASGVAAVLGSAHKASTDAIVADQQISPEYTASLFQNGLFKNPWSNYQDRGLFDLMKLAKYLLFTSAQRSGVPSQKMLDQTLPVLKIDSTRSLHTPAVGEGIRATWIGHATCFVQMAGLNIITDPVFSERCSPSQSFGPKRYRQPPCQVSELPRIDVVVISHNHYDHLDLATVKQIGNRPRWFVPLGLKSWMNAQGITNVVELDWWETASVNSDLQVTAVPAQHWSNRINIDKNKSLWCGYVFNSGFSRFYFAGDTGYCDVFKEIGRRFAPIDLAAIPIGAYYPRWFMSVQHVDPKEAVQIHQDVGARHSFGIHWGTFVLTREHYLEPPKLLADSAKASGLKDDVFFVLKHGENCLVQDDNVTFG
eukprot:CAMPEP_0198207690 /NCGR_PEP_ID=MMETSP1445-20131203/11120_1 /TAXON_ID=36898 /ORGANISM="Pyramimonas sp., Strain CCMP2087" /LENGTH=371 /DNA_ID=CAMNT_0043880817 /DNA_START=180 /DNA_END=1295 /DNA_ORIENTATION=-